MRACSFCGALDAVHGLLSGGSADSSAEREFPSDKVYRRDDPRDRRGRGPHRVGFGVRRHPHRVGRPALSNRSSLQAASPVVRCLALFVFPNGDGADVADSAVRPGLRRVDRLPALAAPRHVSVVARTPHRADRPARVAVGVAVGAAGGWYDDPAAFGWYEVADEVVGEVVALFGHGDVQPELPTGYPRRRLMNATTEGAAQQRLSARSRSVFRTVMTHEMSRFSAREGVPSGR
jgi:hypothetical protein